MNNTFFFDTSAVVKLYHYEIGTERVESIFREESSSILLSELTMVELHSAVVKKIRMKEITEDAGKQAIRNFQKDCADRFLILPLGSKVVRKAKELIDRHGNAFAIRTLDAIQLAACKLEEDKALVFVCADINLIAICQMEGIQLINPETTQPS